MLGFLSKWSCPLNKPQEKEGKKKATNHHNIWGLKPLHSALKSRSKIKKRESGRKTCNREEQLGSLSETDVFLDQTTAQPGHSCGIQTLIPEQLLGYYHDSNKQHNHSYCYLMTRTRDILVLLLQTPSLGTFSSPCHKNLPSENTLCESLTQNSAYWTYSKDATNHFKMVHNNWKGIGGNKEHDVTANSTYQPVPPKTSHTLAFTWSCCNSESGKETKRPKTLLEERCIL